MLILWSGSTNLNGENEASGIRKVEGQEREGLITLTSCRYCDRKLRSLYNAKAIHHTIPQRKTNKMSEPHFQRITNKISKIRIYVCIFMSDSFPFHVTLISNSNFHPPSFLHKKTRIVNKSKICVTVACNYSTWQPPFPYLSISAGHLTIGTRRIHSEQFH